MTADAIVVGGGLSGLASAVQLALNNFQVVLIEQSNKLGGRTSSFVDQRTGDVVDNGQHVLVGAYHHTLKYLELVGTRHLLRPAAASSKQNASLYLRLHHPTKGFIDLSTPPLPHPYHLAGGLLLFRGISLADRLRSLRLVDTLRKWDDTLEGHLNRLSIAEWLDEAGQSTEAKRSLWYPLAISIMNELPESASALLFARSLQQTLLGKKEDAALLIATAGQSELYVEGARRILKKQDAKVLLNTEVRSVLADRGRITGVEIKGGRKIKAKSVVSAVPYFSLRRILPENLKKAEPFSHLHKIPSSPIVSLHLWYDRKVMEGVFVGLIDRDLQWLFNRRKIFGEEGKQGDYISAVISGAHRYVDMTKSDLVALAHRDIRGVFPIARKATLLHSVVIKEKRATLSPTNETEVYRPGQKTPLPNFFLAGDWTKTGLPATIEGAVKSGFMCADLITQLLD